MTTDQMVAYTLIWNKNLGYLPSTSPDPNSTPADTGYWLPVKSGPGSSTNSLCTYCVVRQNPR